MTSSSASYEIRGGVALVRLDNPPVNGLAHALRQATLVAIDDANDDDRVDAIVLTGVGKLFSAGADVREFGTPKAMAEPTLRTLIAAIESSAKPVVAAINGTAMGGGLELAMGCHYRVADASASLALPEVKLGIVPGAGGTQRLPRAIGVENALNMIVSGTTVAATRLRDTALLDDVVDRDVLDAAMQLAGDVVATKRPKRLLRDIAIDYPEAQAYFQFARNTVATVAKGLPAPAKCIDAVEAAVSRPFDEGLRYERQLFNELQQTSESRALRHVFFAERAAARIDDVPEGTRPRPIAKVAVIGAGTMGAGIAVAFLTAGLPVVLLERDADALANGVAAIEAMIEGGVKRGKVDREAAARTRSALSPTLRYEDLALADLVVEAVFEDMDIKRDVFARLDATAKSGAILATNTSALDVDRLASGTQRPQDVVGLHFFSPAHVMKLVEIVRGDRTSADVLVTAMQLAKRIGKTPVVARVCDGFIGNRIIEPYLRQAMLLVEDGASPAQVDAALERFGMAMGPFRTADLVGNDVGWRIRQRRYVEHPDVIYSRIADRLCEAGRFGQKTLAGWYRYEKGRKDALPDADVDRMIETYRAKIGVEPRRIASDEIVDRCILALVNEGARVLEEGIAQRASDIDLVYLTGYGFPRQRGGPMFYADTIGLFNVVRRMGELAAIARVDPQFWQPAPLLANLAAENRTFNG
ncbi:MAG TPA: 3-hydroxyacyl-CoA dehydrogenase NAD-binding domain-containing protein [Casimicrobiaceae bacterium]|nr:3-hydroxyacyl-CoA dehydrogenase NAD-binding domain-containing protein [Casimicrobiaceae bacterium]